MLERADLPQMRSTVLADASALNSVLAFRAVPYVFCSADRTKSGSRVRALKAKRYSRLSSLSIPIPSRVARDAIGFSPQAIQFFANCMYHYAVVHLGPPRREIRLPRIRTTPLGTMRITPPFLKLGRRSAGGLNVRPRRSALTPHWQCVRTADLRRQLLPSSGLNVCPSIIPRINSFRASRLRFAEHVSP